MFRRGSVALLCFVLCAAPQAPLVDRLGAARSVEERARLLEGESASVNGALVDALGKRGDDAFSRYDYANAIEWYRAKSAAAERLHDPAATTHAQYSVGRCQYRMGKTSEAVETLRGALAISGPAQLDALSALVWRVLSTVYQQRGELTEALDAAGRSRKLYQAVDDQAGVAATSFLAANSYFQMGQYRRASEGYEESLRIAEGRDNVLANSVLSNLASLYSEQGDYDVALSYLERVTHSATFRSAEPRAVASTLSILATTLRRLGRYEEALETVNRGLALAQQAKDRRQVANLLTARGTLLYYTHHLREALTDYQQSSEITASENMPWTQIYALSDVALTQLDLDQPELALQTGQQALAVARQLNSPSALWEPLNTVGKAYRRLKRRPEAEAAFLEAVSNIESWRAELAGGEQEGRSFFSGIQAPYYELLAMRVEENNLEGALELAERAKARQLLDVLARGKGQITRAMSAGEKAREKALTREAAKWNDALAGKANPDAATLAAFAKAAREFETFRSELYVAHPELKVRRGESAPLSLAQSRALTPDSGTVLLEFSVTEEAVFLFVLEHSGAGNPALSVYRLAVASKTLSGRIEDFRRQLAGRDLGYRRPAEDLYRALLGPVQARLKGKTLLGIIPDGPLWDLPFQALIAPGGKSLLEQLAVFYAPSLTALSETMRQHRAAAPERTLLAMGPSDGSLPQATAEVRELGKLYGAGSADVYIGAEASELRWKEAAPRYRILHLATHGVLNGNNPLFSYLKLGRGTDGVEDGMLEAREILDLDLRAELAVLSACETARGEFRSGEGVVGMSWALMMAGTPAVVVSQWKVESASTTQLMLALHRNLHRGLSAAPMAGKAEALRKAAMEIAADPRYRHPFYWAGFAVLGNGY